MHPVELLYVNGGSLDYGGISSYMMNYYQHFDRDKVHIDFVVHGMEKGVREQEVLDLGSKVYHIPFKSKNYFDNIRGLDKIFNLGKYKIVHSHMDAMNAVVLKEAQRCKIPIRISHSHNTSYLTSNKIKIMLNEKARKDIPQYATHLFACSQAAGRWLYGDVLFDDGKVTVIKNAIDINKYVFNDKVRNEQRKKLGITDQIVIGHVGKFDYQKNHMFLLDIFAEFLKLKPDSILMLVGDGHLRDEIEKKICNLEMQSHIKLLGQRSDVENLLSAFDFFIFPSLFEGLPIALLEAQVAGLSCLTSDVVPGEVKVNNTCEFLPLGCGARRWAEKIEEILEISNTRIIDKQKFSSFGYDIFSEANKLQQFYLNLAET